MAGGVEYIDEPALVLMLCDLPADGFQVSAAGCRWPPPAARRASCRNARWCMPTRPRMT